MKFGVTLRTGALTNGGSVAQGYHHVVLCRGMDIYQASKYFNQLGYTLRLLKGCNASTTHSRGGMVMSLEWVAQKGEMGDDLCIFIDEYEDE